VTCAARFLTVRAWRVALSALVLSAGVATSAAGQRQTAPANLPRARMWEISGGGVFIGGVDLGERTAELTSNTGTTGGAFALFVTGNQVKPAPGFQGRIGFVVTPALAIEGGVRFTRPVLEVRISGDAESAPNTTAEETLSQYLFDASAVWHFKNATFGGGRGVPFVFGGAGYLRELHEGDALVEEGVEYHGGGGVKWWLGAGRRRFGMRAELGISIRDGGFDFEEKPRVVPVAGGSLIWLF